MFEALDGPSKSGKLTGITTTTAVEVKKDATAFTDRKVLTLQGSAGFYWYLADEGETPSAATVADNGFIVDNTLINSIEASGSQAVWVTSIDSTIEIRFAERA